MYRFSVFLVLVMVLGCARSPAKKPFTAEDSYTATEIGSGLPVLTVNGISDGWVIYPSSLASANINAGLWPKKNGINPGWKTNFSMSLDYWRSNGSAKLMFAYDQLKYKNYIERANFIQQTSYAEKTRKDVGYGKVIIEPYSYRGLDCMRTLTSKVNTPNGLGYTIKVSVGCTVVMKGKLAGFGYSIRNTNWVSSLESLKAYYGESYLRQMFKSLEKEVRPTLDSLKLHVDFNQNPDDLAGYNFPPVPKGMTYTGFYLDVIPEQFQLLTPPYTFNNRVLTKKDVVHMMSKGLTLPMAKKWLIFMQRSLKDKEVGVRKN